MGVALLASLISLESPYWFLPLIFAVGSLIGFYSENLFILDGGILISIISYLFVNRGLAPTISNVLVVVGLFFLFISVWFWARNEVMIGEMEDNIERNAGKRYISFRRDALEEIISNLIIAVFLAIFGSIIAMYSSLEIGLSPDMQSILMVFFSCLVFFIIYLKLNIIYSEDTEG